MQQLDEAVQRYLTELDRADRDSSLVLPERVEHLKHKLQTIDARRGKLKQIDELLKQAPDRQVSLTDPDARSMATSGRGTGIVGYNLRTAVDLKHHWIASTTDPSLPLKRTPLADGCHVSAAYVASRARRVWSKFGAKKVFRAVSHCENEPMSLT